MGRQVNLSTSTPTQDILYYKGNRVVVHWELYPVGCKFEPWIISPDVMYHSGYARQHITNKENLPLWDYPEDLWEIMNK